MANRPPGRTPIALCLLLAISCSRSNQGREGRFVSVSPNSTAIGFVQTNNATPQSPAASVSVPYGVAQSAGNLNVVVVGWHDTTAQVASVTDTMGNAYRSAVGPTLLFGQLTQSIYYASNIGAAAAGANSVTVSFTMPAVLADVRILEYSGLDPASPVDVTASATGSAATSSTPPVVTSAAPDLLFAANTVTTTTSGPGSGWTSRVVTFPDGDIAEDQVASAAGSYGAAASLVAPGPWVMQMVAFKTATSAPPPTAPSNLAATAAGSALIDLSWNNTSTTQTGVKIERSTDNVTFTQITVAGATAASYSDSGLSASTTYSYRVRATSASGDSAYSNTASATTAAPSSGAPIAFVQTNSATPQTSMSSVSVPYTFAQSTGDLNVVVVGWNDTTAQVGSVTDTKGNAYQLAVGPTQVSGLLTQSIYYATNIGAAAAGGNAVNVSFTVAANFADIRILEYAGLDPGSPVDATASATGSSATSSTPAAVTTNASDLLFAANTVSSWTTGPGTGWTSRVITNPDGDIAEDRTVAVAGSYDSTAPLGSADAWVMQMVAFKAAPTGPPPPPPSAPTNFAATAASSARIDLSWSNTSTTQTGVKIERSTDNATFTQIALAGATAASYSDVGLSGSTTYSYRARATNASGDSAYSNTASATTPVAPPNGQWSGPFTWPIVAVHMNLLPTGQVLVWEDHTDGSGAQLFDPASNSLSPVPFTAANLFCAGHALLPDGRVFVAGGHSSTHVGISNATIFDPASRLWSSVTPMPGGRWYPTVTALPDGRMLVTAGEVACNGCNSLVPAIYDPAMDLWMELPKASQDLPYYPHMLVLPDGRVLASSANRSPIASLVLDITTQTWTTVDPAVLDGGSAAMYLPGKIIKSGLARDPDDQGAPSVATTYLIDMTQPSPAWRQTASMAFPRTEHDLTLLPDGSVLATGGSRNSDVGDTAAAVLEAELWSPTTETWTTMAAMKTPRMYHSNALLLPDGRVLVAGGGRDFPEVDQLSAEFYSPPYLFKGPRPTIASAPARIQYATAFSVGTPDGGRIAAVSLLRLGTVTHAFNENQRFVPLTFQTSPGGLTVQAPATANLAPPGHYMLFIVDTNGVPAPAAIVKVG